MESPLRERVLRHSRFAGCVRTFFQERGYAEVETPILSPFLVPEPSLEVFETEYLPARGGPSPLWLAPSPELWMKRLLAGGSGSIFQISRCFRNSDYGGPHHNPEFRLLEWYTQGADYLLNIEVTEELFSRLLSERCAGRPVEELSPPFDRLTMQEAFERFAGIDLSRCRDAGTMADEAARAGVTLEGSPTWEQSFHIAFLTLVEPRLPRKKPLVLLDYPALVPTTARRKPGTPWSERWELFIDGVEIANVYTEETDAAALQAFVAAESARRGSCRTHHAADPAFAGLFPPGFPPCTGAALGMDRLEMVFSGQKSLEGVILFPFSSIVGSQSSTTG
jgi:elongation factor P--(R)-beta-lysine ligase